MAGCLTEHRCIREQQGEGEGSLAETRQAQEQCHHCGSSPTVPEKGERSTSGNSNQVQPTVQRQQASQE